MFRCFKLQVAKINGMCADSIKNCAVAMSSYGGFAKKLVESVSSFQHFSYSGWKEGVRADKMTDWLFNSLRVYSAWWICADLLRAIWQKSYIKHVDPNGKLVFFCVIHHSQRYRQHHTYFFKKSIHVFIVYFTLGPVSSLCTAWKYSYCYTWILFFNRLRIHRRDKDRKTGILIAKYFNISCNDSRNLGFSQC